MISGNPPPDRFWKRFAVVVCLLITIPIAIAIIGIIAAFAVPGFVKARERAQHARHAKEQHREPAALFSPVIDPSLGTSGYQLDTVVSKPGYAAIAKFQIVDENSSDVKTIPQLSFSVATPETSSNFALITTWRFATNESGARTINLEGAHVAERQHQATSLESGKLLPTAAKVRSWRAVRPTRSFWVGPGEWQEDQWNVIPVFEGLDDHDKIVARARLQLRVGSLRADSIRDWGMPVWNLGDDEAVKSALTKPINGITHN